MKTVVSSREECCRQAAHLICEVVRQKPDAVIALDCAPDLDGVYTALGKLREQGAFHPEEAHFFTVREIANGIMKRRIELNLERAGIMAEQCVFLTDETLSEYDSLIRNAGTLEMALLTVEGKGRIGFNEPSTPFESETHRCRITKSIREELSRDYPEVSEEQREVLTMGIHTIEKAKKTAVVAFGERKANAVYRMMYGRNDSTVPAAFLQLNRDVMIYLDEGAASEL